MERTPEKRKVEISKGEGRAENTTEFVKVEVSPSNRAQCRKCKTNIDKGEVRLAICFDDGMIRSYPWRHLNCFYLTRAYIDGKLEPADIRGYSGLSAEQKLSVDERVVRLVSGELEEKSAKKKRADGKSKYIPDEDPALYKEGGYTPEERAEFYEYLEEYGTMTLPELRAMLQYNEQPKTGTKQEVLERVADGWLLGSIPKCPHCEHGHLTFNRYSVRLRSLRAPTPARASTTRTARSTAAAARSTSAPTSRGTSSPDSDRNQRTIPITNF